jgi:hypothetical protein
MDPTMEELQAVGADALPLKALQNYIGIKDELKEVFFDELGGIDMVRELVYIPIEDWSQAVAATEIKTDAVEESEGVEAVPAKSRHLKPKEKGQVGMLRRFARLLVGLPGDEGGPLRGQAAEGQCAGGGAGQQTGAAENGQGGSKGVGSEIAKRKFKISSVLDQHDDQEVEALAPLYFREAIRRFKVANDGLEPSHVFIEGAARGPGGGGGARGHDDRDRGHAHRREVEKAKKKRKYDAQLAEREIKKRREHDTQGAGDKGGGKGKERKTGKGMKQICYAFNRDAEGCVEPCPNGRKHLCETCGGQHPASSSRCPGKAA